MAPITFVPPPAAPVLARPDVEGLIPTTSAAIESQIKFLGQQQGALPGIFNSQRQRLAANASRSLTDQRLFERAAPTVASTAADGSQTFGLGGQFEGRAFRQARTQNRAQTAASGLAGSSNARQAGALGQQGLLNQRQALERSFADQQFQSLQNQQQQSTQLGGQLQQAQGEAADFATNALRERDRITKDFQNQQAQLNFQAAQASHQAQLAHQDRLRDEARFQSQFAQGQKQFNIGLLQSTGAASNDQLLQIAGLR